MPNKQKGSESRLNPREVKFIAYYIETGSITDAVKLSKYKTNAPKQYGLRLLAKPKIQKELAKQLDQIRSEHIASSTEIMTFYTDVMRGKIQDQFGLDATLADRIKAADALAKRQIDMEQIAEKARANEFKIVLEFGDSIPNNTPAIEMNDIIDMGDVDE